MIYRVGRSLVMRARIRIGRRLLMPLTKEIHHTYTLHAKRHFEAGDHETEANCDYIAMGVRYLGVQWPYEGGR